MKHSAAFEKLVNKIKPAIKEIDCSLVAKKLKDEQLALIDVREDHEWRTGRIPGAIHLGRGIIERDIEKFFPNYGTEIILYCGGGYRSILAAYNLQLMGFQNVYSMQGGYRGWVEKSLPTVNDENETNE